MGLDQFAYTIDKNGNKQEISYWRKHPNLQGWMENLWMKKGRPGLVCESDPLGMSDFNCIPVQLTIEDIESLERDITASGLPNTIGFFFGNNSDDYYREQDLDFIQKAKDALDNGLSVYYDSWW